MVLAVVAAVVAVGAIVALYLKAEIGDRDRFADRAVVALDDSSVRDVVARQIVVGVIERGSPDLISARPLLETAVETVVTTRPFRSLVRTTAQQAHSVLLDHGNAFVFDLADTGTVVLSAVRSLAPDVAAKLPANADATLVDLRERPFAQDTLAAADTLRKVAIVLPVLALLLLIAAIGAAKDRSRAFARFALALGVAATVAEIALGTARTIVVRALDGTEEIPTADLRAAVGGVWDAFLGDLAGLLLIAAVVGFVLAAGVLSAVDPEAIRRQAARLTRRPESRVALGARGVLLTLAGIAVLLDPAIALRALAFLIGAALIYAGSTELLTALGREGRPKEAAAAPRASSRRRIAIVLAAAVLTFAAASGAAALVLHENGPIKLTATPAAGCNGQDSLCDKRLNEVLWPGTHNSMAAADVAGWSIPDQRRSIARQLNDGIRLFLLDPHYGRVLSTGRVQTDFKAEGRNANKVAAELSPDALAAVDRLGVNLTARSGARGQKEVFLCHTVCELGATRFTETLSTMRTFLRAHPSTVLMMILENYVTDEDLQRAFATTKTEDYAVTLKRGEPLPTLRELIDDDQRLVVFTEEPPTGSVPWLNDAFTYIQDTPLGNRSAAQLATKCTRYRGTADSPFLMLNNWVERFPPSPTANRPAQTSDFLNTRIARCAAKRDMPVSLIATDFYEQGDLVGVAKAQNATR
ncbi:DUF308 domain-containing protein [Baekduia sp. Peel2402]|uniref:DUF308 domain-containing protein n=1 Tax=Baekduia sp. Peel2402 TaxID=3458296 RepID=UPI00403ECAAC